MAVCIGDGSRVRCGLNDCIHPVMDCMIHFMVDNGLSDENIEDYLREVLIDAMAVREYFLEKADELIKKLQNAGADSETIKMMLKRLNDLDSDSLQVNLDDEIIEVEETERIKAIRKGWKKTEA